ncbi:(2,3-dihydroxybenzoyl)adenylate synthase [Pilimelia columellifera]|uniref:(2,3-dihydroxybenzoyl)adenylate synthase n=1 Tax=Pilimelia columellifera TaxID=706574 RepID=UPI0031D1C135
MSDGPELTRWPAAVAAAYRTAGYWRGQSFGAALREWARRSGDRPAALDGDRTLSYAALDAAADRFAAGLVALGVRAGQRVVVQLPNTADFLPVVFGLWRAGAVPVFALPAHRHSELGYFCRHSDAVALIIPDRIGGFDHRSMVDAIRAQAPTLRHVIVAGEPGPHTALSDIDVEPVELADPDPSGLAFLNLSGGSTGLPKLIPRTADDYLYSVRVSVEICRLGPETRYLCALPVAHNFTLSSPGVLGVLMAGGTVIMCPNPAPDTAFPLIERRRATMTALVPPLALLWLNADRSGVDLSSLRLLQVGGARLPDEAARRVRGELGCALQQVFGMAEGLVNYTRLDDPDEVVNTTQGRPMSPADEVRIVDDADREVPDGQVGHLLTRGPYTVRGYFRAAAHNATAFTAEGFYRTGDLVRRTPDGNLVVTGRAKDQINRGGEKIAVDEIEAHLLAHDAVHDAVLVGVPDQHLGERSCAVVVLRPKAQRPSPAALRRFVRERGLAGYKTPDRIEIVDEFPVTGVGKISRAALRAALRRTFTEER